MSSINSLTQKRSSSCVESIEADIQTGTVLVAFKTGNTYVYNGVSRDAISRLLTSSDVSLGFWVHNQCIKPANVTYKLIKS